MNAVISGQSGVALLIDGLELFSAHVNRPAEIIRRGLRDIPYLLGDAKDLQLLENVDVKEIEWGLNLATHQMDAFHLALLLLDPELASETRRTAAEELVEELVASEVADFVENVLYSHPLPCKSDLSGALACLSKKHTRSYGLLSRLGGNQEEIHEVWLAWEKIPDTIFESNENRQLALTAAVRDGLFKTFVNTLKGHVVQLEEISQRFSRVQHCQDILSLWKSLVHDAHLEACSNGNSHHEIMQAAVSDLSLQDGLTKAGEHVQGSTEWAEAAWRAAQLGSTFASVSAIDGWGQELVQQTVDISRRALGLQHSELVSRLENLTLSLSARNGLVELEEQIRRSLDSVGQALRGVHSSSEGLILASIHARDGWHRKVFRESFQQAADIGRRAFGLQRGELGLGLYDLPWDLSVRDQLAELEEQIRRSMNSVGETLREARSSSGDLTLASIHARDGYQKAVQEFFQQAADAAKGAFGSQYRALVLDLSACGGPLEASEQIRYSMKLAEEAFKLAHSSSMDSILASILTRDEWQEEIQNLLQRTSDNARDAFAQLHGLDDLSLGLSLESGLTQAREQFERSLRLAEGTVGMGHFPHVRSSRAPASLHSLDSFFRQSGLTQSAELFQPYGEIEKEPLEREQYAGLLPDGRTRQQEFQKAEGSLERMEPEDVLLLLKFVCLISRASEMPSRVRLSRLRA